MKLVKNENNKNPQNQVSEKEAEEAFVKILMSGEIDPKQGHNLVNILKIMPTNRQWSASKLRPKVYSKQAELKSFSLASTRLQYVLPSSLFNKITLAHCQTNSALASIPTFFITLKSKASSACNSFHRERRGSSKFTKKV